MLAKEYSSFRGKSSDIVVAFRQVEYPTHHFNLPHIMVVLNKPITYRSLTKMMRGAFFRISFFISVFRGLALISAISFSSGVSLAFPFSGKFASPY